MLIHIKKKAIMCTTNGRLHYEIRLLLLSCLLCHASTHACTQNSPHVHPHISTAIFQNEPIVLNQVAHFERKNLIYK